MTNQHNLFILTSVIVVFIWVHACFYGLRAIQCQVDEAVPYLGNCATGQCQVKCRSASREAPEHHMTRHMTSNSFGEAANMAAVGQVFFCSSIKKNAFV